MTSDLIQRLKDASGNDAEGHLADAMRSAFLVKFGVVITFDQSRDCARAAIAALSAREVL